MPINNVEEKLKALFDTYTKNLPGKIDAIEKTWLDLLSHWDQKQFQTFHRDVHSLCGSAGTYGYIELGKSARQLEIYLKLLLDSSMLSIEQEKEITQLLNNLKTTFNTEQPVKFVVPVSNASEVVTPTNNIVYIIDNDEPFYNMINNMKQFGYIFYQITDLSKLPSAVKNNKPVALFLNIDLINENNNHILQTIQKNYSLPLFCTSAKGDILTRLKAVRMNNIFFMQKPVDEFYIKKILDQICGLSTEEPYRVLIVDDSQSLAQYFSLILQDAGMATLFITNPLLIIESINAFQPDLILMDVYMPECSGLEVATVLRQDDNFARIPIIFLSTEDDRSKQLSALNLGGDDFLNKPILPNHLIEIVKSRAKRAGTLSSMMMRDSLTGLFNHTAILQRLDVEISRAERQSEPLCFVMLDVDHFKRVNDKHGHLVGDRVLKSLSNLLLTSLRKTDIIGRYGGEEFAIILPNTDKEEGLKMCNDLREQFSTINYKLNKSDFKVTFSAGIAIFPEIKDTKNIIIAADKALYMSKKNGRNQIILSI